MLAIISGRGAQNQQQISHNFTGPYRTPGDLKKRCNIVLTSKKTMQFSARSQKTMQY
jgi:hypothetical protein